MRKPLRKRCIPRPRRAAARRPARASPLRPTAAQVRRPLAPSTSIRVDVPLHVAGSWKIGACPIGPITVLEKPPRALCSRRPQACFPATREPRSFAEFYFFGATDGLTLSRFTTPVLSTLTPTQVQLRRRADAAHSRHSSTTASYSRLRTRRTIPHTSHRTRSAPPMTSHEHTASHSPHVHSMCCGANRQ